MMIRLGLGTPGGLEIAHQTVSISISEKCTSRRETVGILISLQENPAWAVISSDRANAFNSFDRNQSNNNEMTRHRRQIREKHW
eukprot:3842055-Pyramimonas_sp.AAC.1